MKTTSKMKTDSKRVSEGCLEGVWKVSGRRLEDYAYAYAYGRCMEDVWKVSGMCVEGVWEVSRRCLKSVWKSVWRVSGRYLMSVWRGLEVKVNSGHIKSVQVNYRTDQVRTGQVSVPPIPWYRYRYFLRVSISGIGINIGISGTLEPWRKSTPNFDATAICTTKIDDFRASLTLTS